MQEDEKNMEKRRRIKLKLLDEVVVLYAYDLWPNPPFSPNPLPFILPKSTSKIGLQKGIRLSFTLHRGKFVLQHDLKRKQDKK